MWDREVDKALGYVGRALAVASLLCSIYVYTSQSGERRVYGITQKSVG